MKLSELRPCVSCNHPPIGPGKGPFYVVRITMAMVNSKAASGILGAMQIVSGGSPPTHAALVIAEALAPAAEDFVMIFSEKDPSLQTELVLCQDCFLMKDHNFAVLVEKANRRKEGL
jgi:hypothetical protein